MHRADRHHRPADGLRHHRRRAGLRAGEVQEAGRRRLLQDRQPEPARRRCARSATREPQIDDDRRLLPRARHARRARPHINHETLTAKGFDDDGARQDRGGAAAALRAPFAFNALDARRGATAATQLGLTEAQLGRLDFDLLARARLHRGQIDEANDYVCGTMTVEGAPHLQAGAPARSSTAPTGAARRASASSLRRPHPHDGRGPAVPLRRDQQDDQHAARRDRRGRQARLPRSAGSCMLKAIALYRDGCKLSQPLNSRRRRRGRGRRRRAADVRGRGRARSTERVVHRIPRASGTGCPTAATATRRRPASAATRSTSAPASTRTARSARSSSTCTRKAPRSAA